MKVSIWQQWSSNHSAAFTVMGKFKTVEDAQQAGDTIKNILTEVARWKRNDREAKWQAYLEEQKARQQPPADRESFDDIYLSDYEPTEIEQQFASQHNLTWGPTLDYARDPELAPQAVRIVDRAVIVAEDFIGHYSWTGPSPFDELLKKLGGEVAIYTEYTGSIQVMLRCRVPDESTATRLWHHIQQQGQKPDSPSPEMIRIDNLPPEPEDYIFSSEWVYGNVRRDGLDLTFTYQEGNHGRYFARLLKYLRALNCTVLDYTFESEDMEF